MEVVIRLEKMSEIITISTITNRDRNWEKFNAPAISA
jgi:hypothetical protein